MVGGVRRSFADNYGAGVPPRYLGLGLLWSWMYCMWFSPAGLPKDSLGAGHTWLTYLIVSAVSLLLLAMRPGRGKPLESAWAVAASLATCLSTLVLTLTPYSEWAANTCAAVGGVSLAVLWVQWGEAYCSIDEDLVESCVPLSAALVALSALVSFVLPAPLSSVFISLLPGAAALLFLRSPGAAMEHEVAQSFALAKERKGVTPLLVELGLVSSVCTVGSTFIYCYAVPMPSHIHIVGVMLGALVAAAFSICTILFARRIDFNGLYQWIVPVTVVALCFMATGYERAGNVALVLSFGIMFSVDCLFTVIFSRITKKGLCAPSEAFGLFRGLTHIGIIVGTLSTVEMLMRGINPLYPLLAFICLTVVVLPVVSRLQEGIAQVLATDAENGAVNPPSSEKEGAGSGVSVSLDLVAERFKLSPRELDVLRLLVKGRSVPYMREALMISKSTVETHIKHLYSKCDVHSKQELIDLVESFGETRQPGGCATEA